MKKKVLFVINTLGHAGAEVAMIELLKALDKNKYDISLFVLMGQGELITKIPEHVKLLNKEYSNHSVLSAEGKRYMIKTVLKSAIRRATIIRRLPYLCRNLFKMIQNKNVMIEKLLWRIVADGSERFNETYDLAIAYLEGGSAYYTSGYVRAKKKAAFVHVDYSKAGYTRELDLRSYMHFDKMFMVSTEVQEAFLKVYPEYRFKTAVFHNLLDLENIKEKSNEEGGFDDSFDGIRLLTVGRLTWQKAYEVAIDAMALLKKECSNVRWYVLGEGSQREFLEKRIAKQKLYDDFILVGAVENPYPYYKQCDIYVHATRFEGKSIAIQEAQTLGCAIVASDCSGNREQIENEKDGLLCQFDAESIKDAILELINDKDKRKKFGIAASNRKLIYEEDLGMIYELMDDEEVK